MVVVELSRELQPCSQRELASQHAECPRTEVNPPILPRLRRVLVNPGDTCLVDSKSSPRCVEVRVEQNNLFRRAQAGKEPELVIVALGFAPIAMDRGDQPLSLVNGEGIDDRSILFSDPGAL